MARRSFSDLKIPDTVSPRLREEVKRESNVQVVLSLFKRGACSAGVAAKMLGLSYHSFLELLKARGVPYVRGSSINLAEERRLLGEHKRSLTRRAGHKRR